MLKSILQSAACCLLALLLLGYSAGRPALCAEEGAKIPVEVEGSESTRMEALKSAWQEAVRIAAGMYMAGKTQVLNDNLTEEIASYSRGQIDSFKIISENHHNGLWQIKISANADRNVLKEALSPTQSQTANIDGANMAAQLQGNIDKGKEASDVARIGKLFDFSGCLGYQIYPQPYNTGGKAYIIIQQVLRMNLDKAL